MSGAGPGADRVIEALGLAPHPEGGHYRETYRHAGADGGRGAMTAIYFLLRRGEVSAWHRVRDADELWIHNAGAGVEISLAGPCGERRVHQVGPALERGQRPQALVPAGWWQSARPLGEWSLVTCTVAPAFTFDSFELAPAGWTPPGAA